MHKILRLGTGKENEVLPASIALGHGPHHGRGLFAVGDLAVAWEA